MSRVPVAMIGVSEGNGHPFSFGAIVNGYDEAGMAASGWDVIHAYLAKRDPSELVFDDLEVTHAWTQDPAVTARLCAACRIPHAAADPGELVDQVGAVIIARDDHESHWPLAEPFLEAGLPVFIDKPLSLDLEELRRFRPYLERGQLMSCSGLRYAAELDEPRQDLASWGELRLVRGAVLFDWAKYGTHMAEAVLGLLPSRPRAVTALRAGHASMAVEMDDGTLVQLDALGAVPKTFRVDLFGSERTTSHEISDNFTMFRRALRRFAGMVNTGEPPIEPERTLDVLRVVVAGERARGTNGRIVLDDLRI